MVSKRPYSVVFQVTTAHRDAIQAEMACLRARGLPFDVSDVLELWLDDYFRILGDGVDHVTPYQQGLRPAIEPPVRMGMHGQNVIVPNFAAWKRDPWD